MFFWIRELWRGRQDQGNYVQLVAQRRFNSYPQNYRKGDFLLHFPDIPYDVRERMMREAAGT